MRGLLMTYITEQRGARLLMYQLGVLSYGDYFVLVHLPDPDGGHRVVVHEVHVLPLFSLPFWQHDELTIVEFFYLLFERFYPLF